MTDSGGLVAFPHGRSHVESGGSPFRLVSVVCQNAAAGSLGGGLAEFGLGNQEEEPSPTDPLLFPDL